jgi:hypothetical protein
MTPRERKAAASVAAKRAEIERMRGALESLLAFMPSLSSDDPITRAMRCVIEDALSRGKS